ncbi:MAG: DNA mismatch repair protein MutS, partial [Anaerolineaceae bacterium]|nr:DNA mismatch repair protein MutS [Anaerolineaceae bacterium]
AVENYLSRLIDKGYHVAICEQVGEQPQKGIFPRQVVRVVTPGTVIEPALLHSEKNNYLLSYIIIENGAALCYVDITTGEFFASEFGGEDSISDLRSEISRLNPAEILIPDSGTILDGTPNHTTRISAWKFEPGRCYALLQKHFDVSTLDGFGLSISSLAVRTAGAVIQYLQDTQPTSLSLLTNLSTYEISDFMSLDSATRRNLELTETIRSGQIEGSLLSILDHTKSPMGKRLIRQWINRPLLNKNKINERLDLVRTMIDEGLLRIELRECLGGITDIERAMNRIIAGHAIPRDLVALRNTLEIMPNLVSILAASNLANTSIASKIDPCADEYDLLVSSIADEPPATLQNTGIIRPGYSAELDNTLSMSKSARDWIANLETTERERTGIKSLKVGFNRVFGYYLEVTHSNTINVPAEYIRKQTLVNAERYITPEMKEYETLVLNAEERIHEIEVKLFKEICQKLSQTCDRLFATSRAIADLDVLASFAEAAASKKYCQPIILDDPILEIVDGRHPVVEDSLSRQKFIPND